MFRWNADACISDSDLNFIPNSFRGNCYPAAFGSVLQSVACEIGQHLHGAVFVSKDMWKVGSQFEVKRDAFGFGMRGESFVHSLHKGGNIQRSNIKLISTGFDAAEFLQIIHESIK